MTIAIDARYVTPHLSGIGRYALNLLHGIQAISPRFAERFIVLRMAETPIPKVLAEAPVFEWMTLESKPMNLLAQRRLPAILEARGVRLLHSPDVFGPTRGNFKRVVTLHDIIPIMCRNIGRRSKKSRVWRAWRWWLQVQCGKAEAVLTDSLASKHDIETVVHVPAEKVHVVYPGIEASESGEALTDATGKNGGKDAPMILYVGRMDSYKNIGGLIRAFEQVHATLHGGAKLVIVGKIDPRFREAQDEARRLKIESAVEFPGFVSDEVLHDYYRRAAVLAFPSLYEGFGLPPLEAMRWGTPVVASNRSCIPEVLGDAALLVDPTDASAFAHGLLRVICEPGLGAQLKTKGTERVARFSVEEQARQTLAVFKRVLG
jgi:glycosyltransferase involved in cell wall biosynthesis